MTYKFLDNKLVELTPSFSQDYLLYPNPEDMRNYGLSFIYPNGVVEHIVRNEEQYFHVQAMEALHEVSPNFSKNVGKINFNFGPDYFDHIGIDTILARKGIANILYSSTDYTDEDAFLMINLPEKENEFIRKFLLKRKESLLKFERGSISRYSRECNHLKELNPYTPEGYHSCLRRILK